MSCFIVMIIIIQGEHRLRVFFDRRCIGVRGYRRAGRSAEGVAGKRI